MPRKKKSEVEETPVETEVTTEDSKEETPASGDEVIEEKPVDDAIELQDGEVIFEETFSELSDNEGGEDDE